MSHSDSTKVIDKNKINAPKKFKESLQNPNFDPVITNDRTSKTEFLTFNEKEQTLTGVPNFEPQCRRCFYDIDYIAIKRYLQVIVQQAVSRGFVMGDLSDLEYFRLNGKARFAKQLVLQALAYLAYRVYLTVPASAKEFAKFAKSTFQDPPVVLRDFSLAFSLIGNFTKDDARYELRLPISNLYYITAIFNTIYDTAVTNANYLQQIFDHDIWNVKKVYSAEDVDLEKHFMNELDNVCKDIGTFNLRIRPQGENEDVLVPTVLDASERPFLLQSLHMVVRFLDPDEDELANRLQDVQNLVLGFQDIINEGAGPFQNDIFDRGNYRFVPQARVNREFLRNYSVFQRINIDFIDKVKKLRFVDACRDEEGDEAIIYQHDCEQTVDYVDDEVYRHVVKFNGDMSFANVGYALCYGFCRPAKVNVGQQCIMHIDPYVLDNVICARFDRLSVVRN